MVDATESVVKPHAIAVELFSRKSNRTTQLIENVSDDKSLDGRNRWYEFQLERPIYAREISIVTSGYSDWDEVEFEVSHLDGTLHEEKIKFSNNASSLQLGKLIAEFRFRPGAKWLTETKIKKVSVSGLTLDEFHAYEWAIKEFDKKEADLKQRESKAQELTDKVAQLGSERSALDGEIGQAKAQLLTLEQSVAAAQKALNEDNSSRADITRELANLREERRALNDDIKASETKLNELTKQVRLFPSEIAGFVKEGNRNILWYICISAPFVIIIFIVLNSLFTSAIDLTQLWRKEENIDTWTVFLTRIPFVVVAIAILEVCGYVVGRLVFEIIKINRQRLSLSKLSIIAKDVSTASAHNTAMTDEELFHKETELKMELLRDHMKEYVSEEFSYKGTAFQSAISAVAEKLAIGGKG
ncbi:hypothetical protein LZA78_15730 [Sinirhodobacter sp. WL0062]|uniref:Uncharacterized protein n=1 Tax=Rhodobacter flavimaris TaxID=2907145 RepID=A0ABS8YYR8_9RHOB|nr:hypothetical protein [Sinirhodobacter sp. WL0062]MCE5974934.1 hypothetical protein [Sinirhodobacter sp. WL0062]